MWTGIRSFAATVPSNPGRLIANIVSPANIEELNSEVTVERIILDFCMRNTAQDGTDNAAPSIQWGALLTVLPTDESEVPVPQALWNPLTADLDNFQKRPLWWRMFTIGQARSPINEPHLIFEQGLGTQCFSHGAVVAPADDTTTAMLSPGLNGGNPYDIRVRRRLKGDECLVMAFMTDSTSAQTVDIFARALLRVGKR